MTREGKFYIGLSCILASILLTAAILVGLGANSSEQDQGKILMLVGGILFILFFIAICTWCVSCVHINNDSEITMGSV
jgi:arginine exporter protein ArgO